jgi:hypothetical protein
MQPTKEYFAYIMGSISDITQAIARETQIKDIGGKRKQR